MIVPDLVPIGEINTNRYERIAETYQRLGMSESSLVPNGFIYKAKPEPVVPLTAEERTWLAAHDKVRVSLFDGPPMQFEENGKFTGYQVEMLEAMLQKVGLEPIYSFSSLREVLKSLRGRSADIALDFILTPERGQMLFFSEKTYNLYMAIFGRSTRTDLDSIDALKNKVIASYIGYGFEPTLKRHLPEARIVRADTPLGMLRLVAWGKADAAVHEIASGERMLQRNLISNVVNHGEFIGKGESRLKASEYVVRKDLPHLMSILDKAYASIRESKKQAIWNKWFVGKTPPTTDKSIVALTPEERQWLDAHPEIRFAFSADYPPSLIVDEDGRLSGILKDVIDLLNQRLGTDFGITVAEIKAVREMAANKEVPGQLALTAGNGASRGLLETRVLWETYPTIYGAFNSPMRINGLEDLKGKTVSALRGARYAEKFLAPHQDKIDIVRTDTVVDALRFLYEGKVDYTIGLSSHAYYILKMRFSTVRPAFVMTDHPVKVVMGVRDDWPQLVEILNKGLQSITKNEWTAIDNKWLGASTVLSPQVSLTPEEKAWLDQNQSVRVRVADWPPYLVVEDNQAPQGIVIEYLKLIGQRTGIRFNYEVTDQPFVEFLQDMAQHQGPDMTALIMPTPEREQYLSFSQAYIVSPYVIFTREQDDLILDISGLTEKTVAVPRGFTVQERLTGDFPAIRLSLFDSDAQALQAVATGQADAYIGSLTAASHIIRRNGLSGLRVSAPSPFGEQRLSMGNRNDWPELTSIIDKALASISEAEKTAIRSKYVALRYEPGINRAYVLKWLLIVGGTTFSILLLILFWSRSLVKMVRVRTAELESSNKSLAAEVAQRVEAEKLLRESRDYLKNLTNSLPDAVFSVKMPERTIEWANDTYHVLGYEPDECVDRTTEFFYPSKEDFLTFGNEVERAVSEGKDVLHVEQTLRTKSGELFPAEITVSFFRTNENVVRVTSIVGNIAERKQAEQKLWEYQHRLKSLASQLTIAEERERRRIAADLHDQIGQTLALARVQLAMVKKSASGDDLTARIDELSESMRQAARDTQNLVFDLSSPSMNELGLAAAISEWLEEKIAKRYGLKTECVDDGHKKPINDDERAILFRNVRELLTNVVKHARANQVSVSIESAEGSLKIVVRDDGIGFDYRGVSQTGGSEGGFGLFSVQERMTDLGGGLEIASEPGKGCRVTLTMPVGKRREME